MQKITLKTLLLIAFVSTLFFACKKKNDQKSKTELLTQKEWFVSKYEQKTNNGPWVDDFPTWDACSKDDKYIFRTNNTLEVNEGATKCSPTDPQIIETIAWALTDNETRITITGSAFIDLLDENSLIISSSQTFNGNTEYERITFRH